MFIVQTLRGTHFILTNVVFNLEWLLWLYDTCITPSKYFKKWGLSVDHFCRIYVWQTYKLYSVCVLYSIHYLKKLNFCNRFSEYLLSPNDYLLLISKYLSTYYYRRFTWPIHIRLCNFSSISYTITSIIIEMRSIWILKRRRRRWFQIQNQRYIWIQNAYK